MIFVLSPCPNPHRSFIHTTIHPIRAPVHHAQVTSQYVNRRPKPPSQSTHRKLPHARHQPFASPCQYENAWVCCWPAIFFCENILRSGWVCEEGSVFCCFTQWLVFFCCFWICSKPTNQSSRFPDEVVNGYNCRCRTELNYSTWYYTELKQFFVISHPTLALLPRIFLVVKDILGSWRVR